MSNIKALRNRIKSVKSTQKITKAMRMVSASKLHRAKLSAEFASKYFAKIASLLAAAKENMNDENVGILTSSLFKHAESYNQTIAIIYSSDRGLCGAYNSTMLRKLRKELSLFSNLKLITIGKKLNEALENNYNIICNLTAGQQPLSISKEIHQLLLEELEKKPATKVVIFYTKFKNILTQIPTQQTIIPLSVENISNNEKINVEFEGDDIIEKLTHLYFEANIIANFFESKASEEAARMTAMDNATKNAGEMINKLTLKMNRTRQAQITKELIEVISGAEAV